MNQPSERVCVECGTALLYAPGSEGHPDLAVVLPYWYCPRHPHRHLTFPESDRVERHEFKQHPHMTIEFCIETIGDFSAYCGQPRSADCHVPAGYQRRKCSECGEGLGFSESDPCAKCATNVPAEPPRQVWRVPVGGVMRLVGSRGGYTSGVCIHGLSLDMACENCIAAAEPVSPLVECPIEGCDKTRALSVPGPPDPPGQWFCVNHRHLAAKWKCEHPPKQVSPAPQANALLLDVITLDSVMRHFTRDDKVDEHTVRMVVHRIRKLIREVSDENR
jgi:hypothetical protein